MAQRNTFLDGDLSDRTSLIHLLYKNDSEDNNEAHINNVTSFSITCILLELFFAEYRKNKNSMIINLVSNYLFIRRNIKLG